METTLYIEICTEYLDGEPCYDEVGFECEVDVSYDRPDHATGWRGGYELTFPKDAVFRMEKTGREFTETEMEVLLALGGSDLYKVLDAAEDRIVAAYNDVGCDGPDPDDDYEVPAYYDGTGRY